MMGPLWWRKKENRLLKCAERTSDTCDPTETDGCCAVIPCEYCLEMDVYGEPVRYGLASFSETHWSGDVDGFSVIMYWERGYASGECEFVVEFNGEEVYRKSCYEGQSCRDSSDSAEVQAGYESGTLSWIRVEPVPLPHVVDPNTGCKTWFCGECECTCECLCVTVITDTFQCKGEACNIGYECEGPTWQGSIPCGSLTEYEVSVSLTRDEYDGGCIISGSFDTVLYQELVVEQPGEDPVIVRVEVSREQTELEAQVVSDCSQIFAEWEFYDGTVIRVACKTCDCDLVLDCYGCCFPLNADGSLANMPFSLSGDDECISETGTFVPLDPTNPSIGACGPCGVYVSVSTYEIP